jgi:AraC-like DNA-binding protein
MENMVDSRITVENLAGRLELSASHFSAIFRKATGMPPMDYFIQLKMQKACELLYSENMKVKDVAEAIGYEDPFYFSRQFKKHMKVSPLYYKENSRKILA